MFTKSWRIYGANGHRQRMSFFASIYWDFSTENQTRIIEVLNSDKTGTNAYSILRITCDTEQQCIDEMFGQIDDGAFENYRVGEIEEMEEN